MSARVTFTRPAGLAAGLVLLLGASGLLAAGCQTGTPVPPTLTPLPSPTPLPSFTPAPSPVPGTLFVDAAQDLGPINPLVYGTNYGPWLFVPLQMQATAQAAHLTLIRWPGGNWGDQNDIDEWQVDQFIAFARQMGAEPFIHVRLNDSTPEKAAALVKLVNVTKGYKVRYWGIGNEPNYFEENTETYNQRWRQWAEAMRAVDPSIQLIGPETDRFHPDPALWPKDSAGRDWLVEFLKANGDLVDVVAVHRYPFPKNANDKPPSKADLHQSTQDWDVVIANLHRLVRENTGRDLPVALTEVNSSWAGTTGGEATLESHYNAIWWADSLGRLIRQNTAMVAQFCIIGDTGLMDSYTAYPIYYVYLMYQHFGTQLVYASSDNPDLSIFAAKTEAGDLTLLVVNLASEKRSYPLKLSGFTPAGAADVWFFDPTHKAELAGTEAIQAGWQLTVPAESVTVYVVPGH